MTDYKANARDTDNTLESQILPNILDSYDLVTYHFKLYMLSEDDIIKKRYDPNNGIIISESGVTNDVYIEEVIITTYNAPNSHVHNAVAGKFDIELREFSGASLMDRIYATSLLLGIRNHLKVPYFLELTFKGRDPTSSDPNLRGLSGKRWVWPICIGTVETDIDVGGATHILNAYPYGDIAQFDKNATIDKSVNVSNTITVREALKRLQDEINERNREKKSVDTTIPDEIEILVHEDFAEMKLVDDDVYLQQSKQVPMDRDPNPGSMETRDINIPDNETIMNAINSIVTTAPEYHEKSKNMKTELKETDRPVEMKRLHRIKTAAEILDYDSRRGEYTHKYTYMVLPYYMGNLQLDSSELSVDSEKKINSYRTRKILRKRYNYLYTGLNDQVIDFQIKLVNAWVAPIPKQAGKATQGQSVSEGAHIEVTDTIRQEKINEEKAGTLNSESERTNTGRKFPVSYSELKTMNYFDEVKMNMYTETGKGSGREYVNSLFKQAYEVGDGGMSKLEVKIKGDPFWLEPAPISGNDYEVKTSVNSKDYEGSVDQVDTTIIQNFVVFVTQTADIPDVTTGIINSSGSFYNGVYSVNMVEHTFTNGVFTQLLTATVDPVADTSRIDGV